MSALTKDRDTPERQGHQFLYPVAAAVTIYMGGLVVLDSAGNAKPGSSATGLIAVGRAEERADNSAGAAGDTEVIVRRGVFRFANSATNPVTAADLGGDVYIEDDQTVTNDATGRSAAGRALGLSADGVWVAME